MHTTTDAEFSTALRDAGLKATAPRRSVLRVLETNQHADAAAIFESVLHDLPDTSLQAVYGVLSALTEVGLVRRIEPAGSPALYERRIGDNHHHVVCTQCGAVRDVDCVVGEAPCLTPSNTAGYAISTADVTFWGVCPDCQKATD
ncbi:Fur family transcriptional regulator [Paramicrobacterium agarici]|uniref:Fur family ferric uptake transcriptional regulator n=1 Tax=Paramicrobacterium agarici TaxID=630514 RepID=A0A2A9DVN2_9MICO|nr:Fur family transcriptional regulator [Microbacterium agarici]PFG30847.1 Fur family ferric uptake transcriptional regulator [Microbacterium agarici]TQO23914.1 Fur family ferric uptake transcriptional regulator [Microbacterium agarici]